MEVIMPYCSHHYTHYDIKCRGCIDETNPDICLKIGKRIPGRVYSVCGAHLKYEGSGMDLSCVDCDRAALEAAGLPLTYEPLIVRPVVSNKKPDKVVAFIGKQLCFFENDVQMPAVSVPVEVMLTRPLYHTGPDGRRKWDSVMAILLRPVTSEYTLLSHRGFECSGSMCSTTATAREPGRMGKSYGFITPGRTQVREAGNVNASSTLQNYTPKLPGKIWAREHEGRWRAEGLARLEDAAYYHAVKK
jgi:hypothetical protein